MKTPITARKNANNSENSAILNCVIYARVSSIGDRQNTARQVADLNVYATANGLNVVKVFEEHISGATKNSDRPVLCACLDYCEANNIDTLLLSELSRLGRNVWEVQENVKRCIDSGLNVYFQKEQISLMTADGKPSPFAAIMVAVLGTCAQMEREAIAYRLNSGRAKYIADGGKLGRKEGSNESKEHFAEKYSEAIKYLKRGRSVREVAKLCSCSPTTIQKVKRMFI